MPSGCYGVSVVQAYVGKDAPLCHLNQMDNDTTPLRCAMNTIIAWPKKELKILQDIAQEVASTKTALDMSSQINQGIESELTILSTFVGPANTYGQKGKSKTDKSVEEHVVDQSISTLERDESEEELHDEEINAYIEEGANAGGDFPKNKDVTLQQDMLSQHLTKLKDDQEQQFPWVPLYRLLKLEKARKTIEWTNPLKRITEDTLYVLACVDLPSQKKTYILCAMAFLDPINVKSLEIPEIGIIIFFVSNMSEFDVIDTPFAIAIEHASFCEWMHVEVLWNTIERKARVLFNSMRDITSKFGAGEMLDSLTRKNWLTKMLHFNTSWVNLSLQEEVVRKSRKRSLTRHIDDFAGCNFTDDIWLQTGTPKDIGKQPLSEHEGEGPIEKELKAFSQSLEQLLDQKGDLQMVATTEPVFDKQNVSISYLDTCMEEKEIVSSILTAIEGHDNGMFITVCIPSQHRMVLDVAGVAGWEPAVTTVTVCKTPVCKDENMTIRSLLLTVFKKNQTTIAEAVVKPNEDTWLDTIQEGEWTTQDDGTPLTGGMERGHCYLYQILNVYTKKGGVVVQYGGDTSVLALLGSQMD
ncbi:hypothetical protein L7F22_057331 [Adiantum nelumboides]|nr:hypothetical protein [Adiantum nelumboides]